MAKRPAGCRNISTPFFLGGHMKNKKIKKKTGEGVGQPEKEKKMSENRKKGEHTKKKEKRPLICIMNSGRGQIASSSSASFFGVFFLSIFFVVGFFSNFFFAFSVPVPIFFSLRGGSLSNEIINKSRAPGGQAKKKNK